MFIKRPSKNLLTATGKSAKLNTNEITGEAAHSADKAYHQHIEKSAARRSSTAVPAADKARVR